jgi:hypothetical protein
VNWVLDGGIRSFDTLEHEWMVRFVEHRVADRSVVRRERFARFGLELHPDKTRLIEFGRYAEKNRRGRGDGKPETFNFLGFTHGCGKTRKGGFTVLRQTLGHPYPLVRPGVITRGGSRMR